MFTVGSQSHTLCYIESILSGNFSEVDLVIGGDYTWIYFNFSMPG